MLRLPSSFLFLISLIAALTQTGCEKPTPSINDQLSLEFNTKFGGTTAQKHSDIKRTSDGGYLLLGTINSTTTTGLRDIYLVKLDADGTQEWAKSFGTPSSGNYTYDEEGVKIAVLNNSYLLAGNKTYYNGTNEEKSKIVLYEVDLTGNVLAGPVELRNTGNEATFSEKITDITLDNSSGTDNYILTGSTTNIYTSKPGGLDSKDKWDMLIMKLDANLNSMWSSSTSTYGFGGEDKGVAVGVLSDGYVVFGITQKSTDNYENRFQAIKLGKSSGSLITSKPITGSNEAIEGGNFCYDDTQQKFTLVGQVTSGPNTNDLILFQLDNSLDQLAIGDNNEKYRLYGNIIGNINPIEIAGIAVNGVMAAGGVALIPNNKGYILSYTNRRLGADTDLGLVRIKKDFTVAAGFPYFLSSQGLTAEAGNVITVEDSNSGLPIGYAFVGTFGTNNQLGVAKIKDKNL